MRTRESTAPGCVPSSQATIMSFPEPASATAHECGGHVVRVGICLCSTCLMPGNMVTWCDVSAEAYNSTAPTYTDT